MLVARHSDSLHGFVQGFLHTLQYVREPAIAIKAVALSEQP